VTLDSAVLQVLLADCHVFKGVMSREILKQRWILGFRFFAHYSNEKVA
jgi:hypothetical protein